MSIYITNMDIPKDEAVALYIYPDGRVKLWRPQAAVSHEYKAVPIPPHGRLIESAELYGKAEDIKTKSLSVCDKPQSWQFGVFWAIEQIEAALSNAPTIITAEEE